METLTLLTGYRGSKAHAVNPNTARNRAMLANGGTEAFALCGWPVMVGDVEFRVNGLACRNCAKAAR